MSEESEDCVTCKCYECGNFICGMFCMFYCNGLIKEDSLKGESCYMSECEGFFKLSELGL